MFIPLYYKPFGLYFMKKLFQNNEWLKHNEQSIVAIDLVPAPCNVTTIQSLQLSPRNICEDFFLKIGILCAKVYTKKVPNIEVCNFINITLRTLSIKQVIVVLY